MKALFDILLVGGLLTVMVMMIREVNRLADVVDPTLKKEAEIPQNEFSCNEVNVSKRGTFGSFILKRLPAKSKDN